VLRLIIHRVKVASACTEVHKLSNATNTTLSFLITESDVTMAFAMITNLAGDAQHMYTVLPATCSLHHRQEKLVH
jgi:hypothetical protein